MVVFSESVLGVLLCRLQLDSRLLFREFRNRHRLDEAAMQNQHVINPRCATSRTVASARLSLIQDPPESVLVAGFIFRRVC